MSGSPRSPVSSASPAPPAPASAAPPAPPDQYAFWNGPIGERWAREQELFDPGLRELAAPAIDAASPKPGEAVLDVGCGCGDTTLILADRVAPGGRVLGLDFSEPMLARAEARAAGRPHVAFLHGDASKVALEPASFDLLFSRFGIMFFPEPEAAFTHLASALRPGGRVVFVCWQPLAKNPWAKVPLDAVASVVGPQPENPPGAPGPFSLDDPARVRRILAAAGLADVRIDPLEHAQLLGGVTSATLDEAVAFATKIGPASRALRDVTDDAVRTRAVEALRGELAKHVGPRGVELVSACWIVQAVRPR